MMKLASLLEVEGVVAALSFLDDGTLLEAAGEIDPLHSDFAAEICYANGRITHQSSDVLATLSGMAGWAPRGWVMLGNELSVCAIANVVCFARSEVVSFNEVLTLLSELERQ